MGETGVVSVLKNTMSGMLSIRQSMGTAKWESGEVRAGKRNLEIINV